MGVNTPNLARIEASSRNPRQTRLPSEAEIWDLLCGAQQLGARVVRTYVLSFCTDGTCHVRSVSSAVALAAVLPCCSPVAHDFFCCLLPRSNTSALQFGNASVALQFNENWFQALDTAVSAASELGLRLIIPFINVIELEQWGGAASLARWAGVPASKFFDHELTATLYKKVVHYVITRKNKITGRLYKNEPAILGWELGNELFKPQCDDLRPPHCGVEKSLRDMPPVPLAWTRTMAQFIRSIDSNHLIISGSYVHSGAELQVEELDIMGGTYYYPDTSNLAKDIAVLKGQRPFLVKEFGLAGFSNFAVVNQTVELITASSAVAGGLYWSLRGHARVRQCDWALACVRFVTCSP